MWVSSSGVVYDRMDLYLTLLFVASISGTPLERAERLFSLKGLKRQDYPKKVRGANFILES